MTPLVPMDVTRSSKRHWDLAKADHDDANPIEYLDLNGLGKAFLIEKGALGSSIKGNFRRVHSP